MATIKDVARHARVTPATVSNVIREKGIVAPATRQRVLAAIEELGYQPNLMARGLVQGRSSTLALLIPDIANPFYPEIALELEKLAHQRGYQLILCNTHSDPTTSREYLKRFGGGWIDGVVALAGGAAIEDLHPLAARGVPVVRCLYSEELERRGMTSALPSVEYDFEEAGRLAAQHLLDLGHRSIAVIMDGRHDGVPDHISRLRGYRAALTGAGVAVDDAFLQYSAQSLESAFHAMAQLLQRAPHLTAVLASNDLTALGATEAIYQRGLSVPGDLSVVGIDNIPLSAYVRPALTTVAFPTRALAAHVIEFLLGGAADPAAAPPSVTLRPELIVRRSTAPPTA